MLYYSCRLYFTKCFVHSTLGALQSSYRFYGVRVMVRVRVPVRVRVSVRVRVRVRVRPLVRKLPLIGPSVE